MASRIALNTLRASGTLILSYLALYSHIRVCSVARETPCCPPTNPLCVSIFCSDFVPPRYSHRRAPSSSRTLASSSSNPPPPAERAAEIVDKLPSHPNLITKTGTAILGSGLLATAISQELYVFNEETVIAVGYVILFAYIAKVRLLVYFILFWGIPSLC
jgi:hypothetical protein